MHPKCEECGSARRSSILRHCQWGWGCATCLACKVLNWFPSNNSKKTPSNCSNARRAKWEARYKEVMPKNYRVIYVDGSTTKCEYIKAKSKQAAERFVTGKCAKATKIQVVVYEEEKKQYAYRGDSSGGI